MAVAKTLPLKVLVGANVWLGGNDWWENLLGDPRWDPAYTFNEDVFDGAGAGKGFDLEVLSDGSLSLPLYSGAELTDYPIVVFQNRESPFGPGIPTDYPGWDLSAGADYYWRYVAPRDAGSFLNQVHEVNFRWVGYTFYGLILQIYTLGGTDQKWIYAEIQTDAGSYFVDEPYYPNVHRWWRFHYDPSADVVSLSYATGGGQPWVELIATQASPTTPGSLYDTYLDWSDVWVQVEISNEVYQSGFDPADFDEYVGPWGQIPVPRSLPLRVTVGDVYQSSLLKALPLRVSVG